MGWVADLIHAVVSEFKRLVPVPPFSTLRITHIGRDFSCIWNITRQKDGKDLMMVVGDFLVTNLTDQTITLPHSLLNRKKRIKGMVLVGGLSGKPATKFLLPKQSEECRVIFQISPPLQNNKEIFIDDVAVVDNFGNERWFKKCRFEYM